MFIRENVANYCIYTKDVNEFVGYCGIIALISSNYRNTREEIMGYDIEKSGVKSTCCARISSMDFIILEASRNNKR